MTSGYPTAGTTGAFPTRCSSRTWQKFDFFARHGVEEILIADPRTREIRWFALAGTSYEETGYRETGASTLLSITSAELVTRVDWPG
ncbi:MAG: hypothetical protein ACR2HM_08300 [Acidimicrobiales bacterium]